MAAISTTLGELGGELVLGVTVILILGLAATFLWRAPVSQQRLGEATLAATLLFLLFACIPLPRPFAASADAGGITDAIVGSRPSLSPPSLPRPTFKSDASEAILVDEPAKPQPGVAAPLDSQSTLPPVATILDAAIIGEDAREDSPTITQSSRPARDGQASEFGDDQDEHVYSIPTLERPDVSQANLTAAAPHDREQSSSNFWKQSIAILYVALASCVFAWLAIGWLRLQLTLRRAHTPTEWLAREYVALPWPTNRRRPDLLISSQAVRPFCYGLWRPCIVVPESDAQPSRRQRLRQILLHELAHAARRDVFGLSLIIIAMPALCFHPAYWWLKRRIEFAAELLADDWAARHSSPATYASELVAWVKERGTSHHAALAGVGMLRSPSAFYRRIAILLARQEPLIQCTSSSAKLATLVAFTTIAASTAAVFGVAPTSTSEQTQSSETNDQRSAPGVNGNSARSDFRPSTVDGRIAELEVGKTPGLLNLLGKGGMRHPDRIESLQCSPDGMLLASLGTTETRLWDIKSLRLLHRLEYTYEGQPLAAFSADGKTLVTGHFTGNVRIWSTIDGKLQHLLTRHGSPVRKVTTTPDGTTAATIDDEGLVCLWELSTGKLRRTVSAVEDLPEAMRFEADGKQIEVRYQSGDWLCWNIETGTQMPSRRVTELPTTKRVGNSKYAASIEDDEYVLRDSSSRTVRLRLGGELVKQQSQRLGVPTTTIVPGTDRVSVQLDESLDTYDLSSDPAKLVSSYPSHKLGPCHTADGRFTFSSRSDGRILGWDLQSGEQIGLGDGFIGSVNAIAYSPGGKYIATGGTVGDVALRLWSADDLVEVEESRHGKDGDEDQPPANKHARTEPISSLQFSSEGEELMTLSNGQVHLWTVPTLQGQQLTTTERAFTARLLPDGTHMVLGKSRSSDTLEVFDLRKGAGVRTLDEHWDGVTAIDASLLSNIVASGSRDHSVVLWDLRDWSVRHRLEGPKDGVLSVSVSDDGTRIAATDETSVHVWDGNSGKLLWQRQMPRYYRRSAVLSPDGKLLAIPGGYHVMTGHRSPDVLLVNVASGTDAGIVDGLDGEPCAICFSPNSRRLVIAIDGGSLSQWNIPQLLRDQAKEDR